MTTTKTAWHISPVYHALQLNTPYASWHVVGRFARLRFFLARKLLHSCRYVEIDARLLTFCSAETASSGTGTIEFGKLIPYLPPNS